MLTRVLKMATENAAKRLKTSSPDAIRIGTHSGHFHADEALAVFMLRQLPQYAPDRASLVRTRDPALLEQCHIVVDVGGEYDAARHRYDHHQRTFTTTFPGRTATRLSSAGLVWLHFGRSIIARRLEAAAAAAATAGDNNNNTDTKKTGEDAPEVTVLHEKIYETFVEAVDAHDNGVSKYDAGALAAAGLEPRYSSGAYTLGAMVARLNPAWNDPQPEDPTEAQAAEDARFEVASARIGEEFARSLDYYARSWLPAREIVAAAHARRLEFDPLGRVMIFEGQSVPWKDHLYTLEEEEQQKKKQEGQEAAETSSSESDNKRVLYVLYPEKPTPGSKWRVQAVPETSDSFQSRKALPDPWRGARDAQLDEVAGLDAKGAVFVHASGFIGGHQTFEGAREMAAKACAF